MPYLHFDNVRIAAVATAVPDFVQKIADPETADDPVYVKKYRKQTGIAQRHISITEQTALDLAFVAGEKALAHAGWDPASVDAIVMATQTPDFGSPSNSVILQYLLGMNDDTLAFDINQGCSAFPYALATCASLMQQEHINRVVMLSGDMISAQYPTVEAMLASETFLFGEASSAVLLEKDSSAADIEISLKTRGSGYTYLYGPFGGVRNIKRRRPKVLLADGTEYIDGTYNMDGVAITSFSTIDVVADIKEMLEYLHKDITDFDGMVLHQANMQIVKTIAKRMKMPMENVPVSLESYANTSAASIPLTLCDAYTGSEKESLSLLCSGFGIGLSWGIATVHITPSCILPIIPTDYIYKDAQVRFIEDE